MSPITSQNHGGALIRAGALNGDNTVSTFLNRILSNKLTENNYSHEFLTKAKKYLTPLCQP